MYKYERTLQIGIDRVFLDLTNALKKIGFAVLSYVDLKEIMKNKLKEDFQGYYIMEVCKPSAAKELVTLNHDYGLFLPCKIVLDEKGSNETTVKMLLVTEMASSFLNGGNEAEKYQRELISAIESI
jgi:uncharacterized protein (DUF302 family)